MNHYIFRGTKKLRCGYTTGSCAAAAAKAAAQMLLSGQEVQQISLMTPAGIPLTLDVLTPLLTEHAASCAIRKDSGDDPDITNGILIYASVSRCESGITIVGGECESAPAMAADGIHDYVTVHTDGVNESSADTKVYPNPTNGQITIEAEGMNRVTVTNALGQTVYDAPADADQTVLDLSQYGTGMYLIRISSEKGVSLKRVSVVE